MNALDAVHAFLTQGGWTLWAMFGVSVLIWARLLERTYSLRVQFPLSRARVLALSDVTRAHAARVLFVRLTQGLPLVRTMIAALPLLGLLGTVAGMIEAFDVLSVFGNSNPRGLSGGISHALISTMVGLVTSLAALYAEGVLSQRIAAAQRTLPVDEAALEPFAFSCVLHLRQRLTQPWVG